MPELKGMLFPVEVILVCIRWYAAYLLSYRHLEEMMAERGVTVDHSAADEVSQQSRRTGPPPHQTNHPADAQFQVIQRCALRAGRNRTHAHDPQGPVLD